MKAHWQQVFGRSRHGELRKAMHSNSDEEVYLDNDGDVVGGEWKGGEWKSGEGWGGFISVLWYGSTVRWRYYL
jgi:hypothetical protein